MRGILLALAVTGCGSGDFTVRGRVTGNVTAFKPMAWWYVDFPGPEQTDGTMLKFGEGRREPEGAPFGLNVMHFSLTLEGPPPTVNESGHAVGVIFLHPAEAAAPDGAVMAPNGEAPVAIIAYLPGHFLLFSESHGEFPGLAGSTVPRGYSCAAEVAPQCDDGILARCVVPETCDQLDAEIL